MFSKLKHIVSLKSFHFLIAFLILFVIFYCFSKINSYKYALSELKLKIDSSYSAGYNDGYSSGERAGSTTYCKGIDSMSPDEIHDYLESVTEDRYFNSEEVSSIFAYAFQRGYTACSSGVVSDMEDEYLNGYLIDSNTALKYDFFFGLS